MPDEQLRIAVFIDFDNIEIGIKSTLSKEFDVAAVLEALKERGEVISKVAYGNWKYHGNASRKMSEHAVQMVQRDPTPRGDKNGADINLALDALEMAFTRPHINAYAIVGGDSDFIALVEKLKQYNKTVFVVGGRGFTSTILQRNCKEFISYENLVRQPEPPARQIQAQPRRGQRRGEALAVEGVLPLMQRALKVLSEREHQPLLGLVKSTMLQLDSTFSERDYGSSSFLDFVQKLAHAGYVNIERVDSNYALKLPERQPEIVETRPPHERQAATAVGKAAAYGPDHVAEAEAKPAVEVETEPQARAFEAEEVPPIIDTQLEPVPIPDEEREADGTPPPAQSEPEAEHAPAPSEPAHTERPSRRSRAGSSRGRRGGGRSRGQAQAAPAKQTAEAPLVTDPPKEPENAVVETVQAQASNAPEERSADPAPAPQAPKRRTSRGRGRGSRRSSVD